VFYQAYDPQEAAFNSADLETCRIMVPYTHRLVSATVTVQTVVLTGTVTVTLKQKDVGEDGGGAVVGTALTNADMTAAADTYAKLTFTLADEDKTTAPQNRHYFLVLSSTDAADRFSQPLLLLETSR